MSVWIVQAAGLGKLTVNSYLGQPFKAEIALESVTDKEISMLSARLASPQIFQKAGINLAPYHATLSVAVEKRADGQPYVRVTSSQMISEPFLKLLIELHSSSGRMLREYNVLLDPAETRKSATTPPVVQSTSNQVEDSAATAISRTQSSVKAERQSVPSVAHTGNTYGPVIKGDTLSRIARQVSPDGVGLNHMLAALYRANRDAFFEKNMNLLKVGVILRIPDEEEISSITAKEAAHEVTVQKESWNSYRQRIADLAGAAPGKSELKQSQSGKIITISEDTSITGSGKPEEVLILSKGELLDDSHSSVKSAESKTAQNYLHMMEEDAIAKERALREANERVAILEQNVAKLQRLLELKEEASDSGQTELDQTQHVSDLQPVPVITDQTVAESSEAAAQAREKSALPVTIPVQPVNPVLSAKPLQPADSPSDELALMDTLIETAMENSEWIIGGLVGLLTIALGASAIRRKNAQAEDLNIEEDLYDFNEKNNSLGTSSMTEAVSSDSESLQNSESTIRSARQATGAIEMENFSLTDDHTDVDPGLFFGSNRQDEKVIKDSLQDGSPDQTQEEEDTIFSELDESSYEIKIDTEEPDQGEYKQETLAETEKNDKDGIDDQWVFTVLDTDSERNNSVQQQDIVKEFTSLHDDHQINFDLDVHTDTKAREPEPNMMNELSDLGSSLANIDLNLGDKPDTKFQSGEYSEAHEMQWQEVATKLDLAKAYLEMDDKEGAKEILEEVLREGDDEQRSAARSILDQIS